MRIKESINQHVANRKLEAVGFLLSYPLTIYPTELNIAAAIAIKMYVFLFGTTAVV